MELTSADWMIEKWIGSWLEGHVQWFPRRRLTYSKITSHNISWRKRKWKSRFPVHCKHQWNTSTLSVWCRCSSWADLPLRGVG
jgi:hypothetical protein